MNPDPTTERRKQIRDILEAAYDGIDYHEVDSRHDRAVDEILAALSPAPGTDDAATDQLVRSALAAEAGAMASIAKAVGLPEDTDAEAIVYAVRELVSRPRMDAIGLLWPDMADEGETAPAPGNEPDDAAVEWIARALWTGTDSQVPEDHRIRWEDAGESLRDMYRSKGVVAFTAIRDWAASVAQEGGTR